MLVLGLTPLVHTGFQLTPRIEDDALVVNFSGNGDMAAVDALGRYLKQVHHEALALKVDVSFDFRELYFMNSSCFKAFVSLIDAVQRTDPRAYAVCFLTNPRIHWQRRSLEALRYLAPKVVEVTPLQS